MESPVYTINKLLNARTANDATNDELASFLVGDGKDSETVAAALAQLEAHNITRLQFLTAFDYS